jgi:hypothetical protein
LKTAVDRAFEHGFVIDEQEMRRIHNLALQQMKRVTKEEEITEKYEVKYHNDLATETTCFDEIFSESNGGKWEIQSLVIDLGTKFDRASPLLTKSQIRLSFKKGYHPVKIHIVSEDRDWVYLTSSQLEDRIAKIKRTDFWNGNSWGLVSGASLRLYTSGSVAKSCRVVIQ